MATRSRAIVERTKSRALVLRRTLVGDADLLVTFFTEARGVMSAAARGARRATSKHGALEPIHTLDITFELRHGADVGKLVEARIETPRLRATGETSRLDAAFRALTWVRSIASPLAPEPRVFDAMTRLLDALDREGQVRVSTELARTGLQILNALGYGLITDSCVICGRPCPAGASATIDPVRGGIVCRACGGASMRVRARLRDVLAELSISPDHTLETDLGEDDERAFVDIVESAIAAHALPPIRGPRSDRRG